MNGEWLDEAAATVTIGYLKRWLEGAAYNRIAATSTMQEIRGLPPGVRYGIEAALNALNAVFDRSFTADTPSKRVIKEVILDGAPELSKRIINGDIHSSTRRAAALLLKLPDDEIRSILNWLGSVPAEQLGPLREVLSSLDEDQLSAFARLPDFERRRLVALAGEQKAKSAPKRRLARELRSAREWLRDKDK